MRRSLRSVLVPASIGLAMLLTATSFATAASTSSVGDRAATGVVSEVRLEPLHGSVEPKVMRELRRSGSVEALVVLDYQDVLAAATAAAPAGDARARSRAIVASTRTAYAASKAGVLERVPGLQLIEDFDALPIMFARFSSRADLAAASADPEVIGIAHNGALEPVLAESLPLINQPTAAAAGQIGSGTAVAVLDSGVDYTRTAFGSCTSPGVPAGCKVVVAQDFGGNDGMLDDPAAGFHGTNVAGIVLGVAPGTKILALDVFATGSANYTDVVSAVSFATANQAAYNIRALNMSLGSPGTYNTAQCSGATNPFVAAFANARAVGIVPVLSAGNDAFSAGSYHVGISFPACTPGAVSVGAVYDANVGSQSWGAAPDTCTDATTAPDKITCFSQTGNYLSLLAPGAMIAAAGITMGGTSQAAPHVAGAAAVLAAANPAATATTIHTALTTTGPMIIDPLIGMSFHRLDLPSAIAAVGTAPVGPTITSFAPTSGPVGTVVTITGTNLTGATAVRFGGVNAVTFTANSATQVTATVPVGALSGPIGVTSPAGTATSATSFTVTTVSGPTITSFAPTSGPVGTTVVIAGTNLNGATSVQFAGVAAGFTVNSPTQITATVPAGAVTGFITVTTPNGVATSPTQFTVTTTGGTEHSRSVSLFRSGNRARGAVSVNDGFAACASGMPLKLQEKRGRWVTVATGTTSATGGFTATGLELQTRYRVVAPRRIIGADVCLKATSSTLLWTSA